MRRVLFCVAAAVLAVASLPSAQQGDKVKAASDFLGAENMKSVRYTGFGANYTVGQAFSPTDAWPKVTIKSYDAQINYETSAMQVDLVREMGPVPPRGGGVAFVGEQRQQHRRIAAGFRAIGDEDRRYGEQQGGDDRHSPAASRADRPCDDDRGGPRDDRQRPSGHRRSPPADDLQP